MRSHRWLVVVLFSLIVTTSQVVQSQSRERKMLESPSADCGAACIYALLPSLSNRPLEGYSSFVKSIGPIPKEGMSLADMERVCEKRQLFSKFIKRCTVNDLAQFVKSFHVIVIVNGNHYVIVEDVNRYEVQFLDAKHGSRAEQARAFEKRWDGTTMLLSSSPIELNAPSRWSRILAVAVIASLGGLILFASRRFFRIA